MPKCKQTTGTKHQLAETQDVFRAIVAQNIKLTLLKTNLNDSLEKDILKHALQHMVEMVYF